MSNVAFAKLVTAAMFFYETIFKLNGYIIIPKVLNNGRL